MLIDWFTVIAQVVNFLILVWLMKLFLYKPVLKAIDAREARIAAELADADAKKAEVLKEHYALRRKNKDFDDKSASLLNQARARANDESQRLVKEAHESADILRSKLEGSVVRDVSNLNHSVADRAQDEIFAIVRKVLAELAELTLEERVVRVFARRLKDMDQPAIAKMKQAMLNAPGGSVVRSAFPLTPEMQETVMQALKGALSVESEVRFETDPKLVSGIEVIADGQKISWNIAGYLKGLEKTVAELAQSSSEEGKQAVLAEEVGSVGPVGHAGPAGPEGQDVESGERSALPTVANS